VDSVKTWLEVFKIHYLIFRISPWTHKIPRAIKKEKKVYPFGYAQINDRGIRFENMVGLELYRAILNWSDLGLRDFSLHYIRNKEKEEVDFLICKDHHPIKLFTYKAFPSMVVGSCNKKK